MCRKMYILYSICNVAQRRKYCLLQRAWSFAITYLECFSDTEICSVWWNSSDVRNTHNSLCKYLCHLLWSMEGPGASSEKSQNSICRKSIVNGCLSGSQRETVLISFMSHKLRMCVFSPCPFPKKKSLTFLWCFLPTMASIVSISH